MRKDTKVIIGVVIAVLVLFGGGYYIMGMNKTQSEQTAPSEEEQMTLQTIAPSEIGFDLQFRKDGKAGKIIIGKANGIKAIEYQISYQKNQDGEDVPEGLIGDIDMSEVVDGKVETEYREFGTCSSGTCRYDNVTSPIKITLKITKNDGKVYQSEKTFELPQ